MNKNSTSTYVLIIVALLALWFARSSYKKSQKIKNLQDDKDDLIILLADQAEIIKAVNESEDLDEDTKTKLRDLISRFQEVAPSVSSELAQAMKLMEAKLPSKAAFSLTKIIENLLKEKYENDSTFVGFMVDKKKRADKARFFDYIEFAKTNGDLNTEEYHFANGLREIRNREGHELGVMKAWEFMKSALLVAVALILKLAQAKLAPEDN